MCASQNIPNTSRPKKENIKAQLFKGWIELSNGKILLKGVELSTSYCYPPFQLEVTIGARTSRPKVSISPLH